VRQIKVFCLFIFLCAAGFAQDSLLEQYRSYPDDTNKINLLYNKGFSYRNTNLPAAIKFAKACYAVAAKLNDHYYLAKALNLSGILKSETGLHREALLDLEKALELRIQIKDTLSQAIILNNMGNVYSSLGQNEKALEFYEKSLRTAKSVNNERWINGSLFSMAEMQTGLGMYQSAEGNLYTLISWAQNKNDHEILGLCYKNMSRCKMNRGDTLAALAYQEQVLDIAGMTEDDILEADALAGLGEIYLAQKKNDESLKKLLEALAIYGKNKYSEGLLNVWKQLEAYYREAGSYKEAYLYLAKYDSAQARVKQDSGSEMKELWLAKEPTDTVTGTSVVSLKSNIFEYLIGALLFILLVFALLNRKNEKA